MSNASTAILSSIVVEEPEPSNTPGITVTRISIGGEAHAAAIVNAVANAYPRVEVDWPSLIGKKVTYLRAASGTYGATSIIAEEGTVFETSRSDCIVAILPKGKRTNGHGITASMNILDCIDGYKTAELERRVQEVRARFPQLKKLTQERLNALPSRSNICSLAVFGTHRMPDATATDAVWLLHSYQNGDGDDIVEGVLFVRPDVGFSEHGSVYGRDLLRFGGEIIDAPEVTLAQAMAMTDWDHDDVLAHILGGTA